MSSQWRTLVRALAPWSDSWVSGPLSGDYSRNRGGSTVSEGQDAGQYYAEAVKRLGRTQLRPELARAHLLYEWLSCENSASPLRRDLHNALPLRDQRAPSG